MSENRRYYWLKLQETFFEDDTIDFIESQENGEKYVLFYLKLCLKALKNEGKLIRYVGELLMPYDEAGIAKLTKTDIDTVRSALILFNNIGLIKRLETGEIYLTQINELIGTETADAQRKRRQRINEKARSKCGNLTENVTPMSQIGHTDIDIELDKDKEIEKDSSAKSGKENKYIAYLNSMSEQIKTDSSNLVKFFYNARKILDEKFERNKLQLLGWQVDFAKFLLETNRSYDEVTNTMKWSFNDSYWNFCSTKPSLFIKHYDELFLRSKQACSNNYSSKQNAYTAKGKSQLGKRYNGDSMPDFVTDYLGVANG